MGLCNTSFMSRCVEVIGDLQTLVQYITLSISRPQIISELQHKSRLIVLMGYVMLRMLRIQIQSWGMHRAASGEIRNSKKFVKIVKISSSINPFCGCSFLSPPRLSLRRQ